MTNALIRSAALCTGIALLAACGDAAPRPGGAGADVPESERYGGTAVVTNLADIPDVNPLTSTDHAASQIQQFVLFMPLVTYDENFEAQPWAARSWEISADTTLLTFHLRDDVFWHDGRQTTAHDWKFSYDLARHPETGFANTAFWTHYGDAEVVDSFTFRVRMRPHAEFLDPWRAFAAVPQHVLEGVAPAQLRTHRFSTREPVGNGPFRFVSRQDQQHWTFEANPDFPAELGGRPYLDRIVYRVIPEATTALTEMLTGRSDYYLQPPSEQLERMRTSDNVRLVTYPDRYFILIAWNQRRPPFDDVRVRQALTMAINRQAIIDGVLYGHGEIANHTVPPIYWQYDARAGQELRYDPDGARRLLAEAGWRPGPDGILRNPQGQPLRFTIKTNQNQTRADILSVVQSDLRRVGVDMQPQTLEWGTLLDQINTPTRRDFDGVLIGWVTEFRIDDSDLFHCEKRNDPYQWTGHCDRELDRLMEQLPLTVSREEARPIWQEYQRRVAETQPYTFLYFVERVSGVSRRLHGVEPDARGDWLDARLWWIHPDERGATRGAQ